MACSECTTLFFIIKLLLEIADLVADWLFALDVYFLESGLVYGQHNAGVKIAIFFFASLGTLTFLVETVNSYRENRGKSHWDSFVVSAIVLWIEDIPQAILSIYIAVCREDGSSRFQLAKAGIAIALAVVQLVVVVIEYRLWIKESWETNLKTFQKYALAFIFIGVFVNIAACVAVFFLSHTNVQVDGSLVVREPTSDFEERYDDRYFVNVNIYIYDRSFQSNTHNNVDNVQWIKVTPINALRGDNLKPHSVAFQYKYQDGPSQLRFALWSNASGPSAPWECYTLNKGNNSITPIPNCVASFLQGNVSGLSVQLVFKPPDYVASVFRKTIYGDITFGVRKWEQGQCLPLTQFQNALPSNALHPSPALHYFRSSESSRSSRHLMEDSGTLRFYTKTDPTDVASIWRTGWTKCSATGHVVPQLDTDLTTQC